MIIDGQIACVDVVEMVTDWMEGEFDDVTRALIEEHLVLCGPCGAYVNQIRQAVQAIHQLDKEPPSAAVRDQLLRLFRAQQADRSDSHES